MKNYILILWIIFVSPVPSPTPPSRTGWNALHLNDGTVANVLMYHVLYGNVCHLSIGIALIVKKVKYNFYLPMYMYIYILYCVIDTV